MSELPSFLPAYLEIFSPQVLEAGNRGLQEHTARWHTVYNFAIPCKHAAFTFHHLEDRNGQA